MLERQNIKVVCVEHTTRKPLRSGGKIGMPSFDYVLVKQDTVLGFNVKVGEDFNWAEADALIIEGWFSSATGLRGRPIHRPDPPAEKCVPVGKFLNYNEAKQIWETVTFGVDEIEVP